MPFCHNCQTEYKGHVSVCPECGEHLSDATLDELEEMAAERDHQMILIYKSSNQANSEALIEAFKDAGINHIYKPATSANCGQPAGISDLYNDHSLVGEFYVWENDYDLAREVAESIVGELDDDFV